MVDTEGDAGSARPDGRMATSNKDLGLDVSHGSTRMIDIVSRAQADVGVSFCPGY